MSSEEGLEKEHPLEHMVGQVAESLDNIRDAVHFYFPADIDVHVFDIHQMETVRFNVKDITTSKLRKVGSLVSLEIVLRNNTTLTFTGGNDVLSIASRTRMVIWPFNNLPGLEDVEPRYKMVENTINYRVRKPLDEYDGDNHAETQMDEMIHDRLAFFKHEHNRKRRRIAEAEEQNKKSN